MISCGIVLLLVVVGITSARLLSPIPISDHATLMYAGIFAAVGFALGKLVSLKRSAFTPTSQLSDSDDGR
jgi:hypothetical protein